MIRAELQNRKRGWLLAAVGGTEYSSWTILHYTPPVISMAQGSGDSPEIPVLQELWLSLVPGIRPFAQTAHWPHLVQKPHVQTWFPNPPSVSEVLSNDRAFLDKGLLGARNTSGLVACLPHENVPGKEKSGFLLVMFRPWLHSKVQFHCWVSSVARTSGFSPHCYPCKYGLGKDFLADAHS